MTIEQIATDFGVHPVTLHKWMRQADIDEGTKPGKNTTESGELREARRRIKLLEQENEVLRRAAAYLSQANLPGKGSGEPMKARTAWRICSQNRLWSVFGKQRGKNGKVGPPVHDDLVERDFTAEAPNQLWLSDITEHRTGALQPSSLTSMCSNSRGGHCV